MDGWTQGSEKTRVVSKIAHEMQKCISANTPLPAIDNLKPGHSNTETRVLIQASQECESQRAIFSDLLGVSEGTSLVTDRKLEVGSFGKSLAITMKLDTKSLNMI